MSPIPSPADCATRSPHFVVGRDAEGRWLALEAQGRSGGIFRSRADALHYARGETGRRAGAVTLAARPLALAL